MIHTLPTAAIDLIERDEGLVLHEYADPGGVPTIGYGHTGPDVTPGEVITRPMAEALEKKDLGRFEAEIERLVGDVATTDNQFGAMVSLAYNIGDGAFARSTVLRKHRAGDYAGAADAFGMWNEIEHKVSNGLVRRRAQEKALYLTQENAPMPDPVPMPPTPSKVNLGHVSAAGIGGTGLTALISVSLGYHFHLPAEVAGADAGMLVLLLGALSGIITALMRRHPNA